MSSSLDNGRIRKRIAEIDQHIAVLMKERDELIFAERVIERLSEGGNVASLSPTKVTPVAVEPDSIEEALSKLEANQISS